MKFVMRILLKLSLVALVAGPLFAQDGESPDLEPIPSPAADSSTAELPGLQQPDLNVPDVADTTDAKTATVLGDTDSDSSYGAVEIPAQQASYEELIEETPVTGDTDAAPSVLSASEGPFSDAPALGPTVDAETSDFVIESPTTIGPVEYPSEFQQQPIQLPSANVNSPPVASQPIVTQSNVAPSDVSPSNAAAASADCACSQKNQAVGYNSPSTVVQRPSQRQVQRQVQQPARYYYQAPRSAPQPTVVVRQGQRRATRYYVVPQGQQSVQPRQQPQQVRVQAQPQVRVQPQPQVRVQVQPQQARVQPQPQQARVQAQPQQVRVQPQNPVRQVGYTQVQVTETTQYRPVQVRVTESYQAAPRATRTVVVPVAPAPYVPFQPIRNAARRRW